MIRLRPKTASRTGSWISSEGRASRAGRATEIAYSDSRDNAICALWVFEPSTDATHLPARSAFANYPSDSARSLQGLGNNSHFLAHDHSRIFRHSHLSRIGLFERKRRSQGSIARHRMPKLRFYMARDGNGSTPDIVRPQRRSFSPTRLTSWRGAGGCGPILSRRLERGVYE